MTVFRALDKVLEWAVIGSFISMILTVCLQVFARYALPWSPPWTEELARFAFIYMVSMGAGLAIKDRSYVNVDLLFNSLAERQKILLDNIILIMISLLMVIMLWHAFPLVQIVKLQRSASLKINMAVLYISMCFMAALVLLFALRELQKNFHQIRSD